LPNFDITKLKKLKINKNLPKPNALKKLKCGMQGSAMNVIKIKTEWKAHQVVECKKRQKNG